MSDIVIATLTQDGHLSIIQEDTQIIITKENLVSFDARRIRKWIDENYSLQNENERVYSGYYYNGKR